MFCALRILFMSFKKVFMLLLDAPLSFSIHHMRDVNDPSIILEV